ncbi:hypothetical protein [Nonomuraea sediminis]|uniref:hypothetical protein n=1 Tax=Nonomuraea sediminis TaxID=2835864 RepID=UPI001BDC1CC1|nr:hypothetical protein [Nonomuraea sediminis]
MTDGAQTQEAAQAFLPQPARSRGAVVNNLSVAAFMSRDFDAPKAWPESVARAVFDGVENQEEDIFPDAMSKTMTSGWQGQRGQDAEARVRRHGGGRARQNIRMTGDPK